MWIYNVCKVREPQGNGYEILERYTNRTIAYLRMFALIKSDKSGHYFVERFSDKKKQVIFIRQKLKRSETFVSSRYSVFP